MAALISKKMRRCAVRGKEFGEAMLQRYVEILVPHNHHQEYLVIIGDWWSMWYYLILGFYFILFFCEFTQITNFASCLRSVVLGPGNRKTCIDSLFSLFWGEIPPKNIMRIWFSSPGLMHCLWYLQQEGSNHTICLRLKLDKMSWLLMAIYMSQI